MARKRVITFLLAAYILLTCADAFAHTASDAPLLTEPELALIEASKITPVTVGVIPGNPPMCYLDEKKKEHVGIQLEIMKALSEKTGLRFEYVPLDLTANPPVAWLRQGRTQIVAGILRTRGFMEAKDLILSDAMLEASLVVVGRRGHDFMKAPEEKTIAVMSGFQVAREYISEQFPRHRVVEYATAAECMDAVVKGRADATVFLRSGVSYYLQNPHYEGLEINPAFESGVDICVVGLAQKKTLLGVINKGLAMIGGEGLNEIMLNYTVMNPYEPTTRDTLYKYRLPLAVISFLVLIVIAALSSLVVSKRSGEKKLQAAYEQEKAALRLAEKASAAKGNFMARMSHEIRTPLNAVIGYNSIARDEISGAKGEDGLRQAAANVLEYLTKSEIASRHLLTIINDVLDMAAVESGRIRVSKERFNFKDMIAALTAFFASQAGEKGVDFQTSFDAATEGWFMGDQMRVNQILTNLLSNAVKFSSSGDDVRLSVSRIDEDEISGAVRIRFEVADTGMGMDKEYLKHLWTPFEQADASIARRFGGTGLGLAITKSLVDLMEGEITVQSELGEGTTFTIELPFERAEQPRDTKEKTGSGFDFAGSRVLLVEDNAMNMEIAKRLLASAKLDVDCAWNGKEAVDMFNASRPGTYAAILMDVQMPEMDGHEAARAIRASSRPDARAVPIIAMTADAFAENVAEALASGMDAHIPKPIDTKILFETLSKHIKKS